MNTAVETGTAMSNEAGFIWSYAQANSSPAKAICIEKVYNKTLLADESLLNNNITNNDHK